MSTIDIFGLIIPFFHTDKSMSTVAFFALVVALFQLKHFLADYPLQGPYMLGKFKDVGWIKPLTAHCAVHSAFTFVIALVLTGNPLLSLGVALLDSSLHFVMDRVKASPKLLGRYKALSAFEMKKELYVLSHNDNSYEEVSERKEQAKLAIESNRLFWIYLGVDQLFHHLTDLGVAFIIVSSMM